MATSVELAENAGGGKQPVAPVPSTALAAVEDPEARLAQGHAYTDRRPLGFEFVCSIVFGTRASGSMRVDESIATVQEAACGAAVVGVGAVGATKDLELGGTEIIHDP